MRTLLGTCLASLFPLHHHSPITQHLDYSLETLPGRVPFAPAPPPSTPPRRFGVSPSYSRPAPFVPRRGARTGLMYPECSLNGVKEHRDTPPSLVYTSPCLLACDYQSPDMMRSPISRKLVKTPSSRLRTASAYHKSFNKAGLPGESTNALHRS